MFTPDLMGSFSRFLVFRAPKIILKGIFIYILFRIFTYILFNGVFEFNTIKIFFVWLFLNKKILTE